MLDLKQFNLQFVIDESGHKKAVILPIEAFRELIEDLEDLALVAERRDEPTIPFSQVVEELKRDGFLSD
jgi:hypothetical protein